MRICLVNPPWLPQNLRFSSSPPLSLMSIATILQATGNEVTIVDLQLELDRGRLRADTAFYHQAVARIDACTPDLVGITSYTMSAPVALRLVQAYRRNGPGRRIPVVLGGPFFHPVAAEVLARFPEVDFVVRGEGEITVQELVAWLSNSGDPATVTGLVWRDRRGTVRTNADRPLVADLDSLPFPDYELLPAAEYFGPDNLVMVDAGRGCFLRCPFCHTSRFWGNDRPRYRKRSPARVVAHMEQVYQEWGVTRFYLTHDAFVDTIGELRHLRDVLRKTRVGSRAQLYCTAVPDRLDPEVLQVLADLGCVQLEIGVETGSQRLFRRTGKPVDFTHLRETVRTCHELGIDSVLSYIIGLPDETADDLDATMRLALELALLGGSTFLGLFSLYPDTVFYEKYRGHLEYRGLYPAGANLYEEFATEDLVRRHPLIFPQFYNVAGEVPATLQFEVMMYYTRLLRTTPRTLAAMLEATGGRMIDLFASFMAYVGKHATAGERRMLHRKVNKSEYLAAYLPRFLESRSLTAAHDRYEEEMQLHRDRCGDRLPQAHGEE